MFGIGPSEILVILVVAFLVLGPKKLPEIGRAIGNGLSELKKVTEGVVFDPENKDNIIRIEDEPRK